MGIGAGGGWVKRWRWGEEEKRLVVLEVAPERRQEGATGIPQGWRRLGLKLASRLSFQSVVDRWSFKGSVKVDCTQNESG